MTPEQSAALKSLAIGALLATNLATGAACVFVAGQWSESRNLLAKTLKLEASMSPKDINTLLQAMNRTAIFAGAAFTNAVIAAQNANAVRVALTPTTPPALTSTNATP